MARLEKQACGPAVCLAIGFTVEPAESENQFGARAIPRPTKVTPCIDDVRGKALARQDDEHCVRDQGGAEAGMTTCSGQEVFQQLKAELILAYAAAEASYRELTAAQVIARNRA